MKRRFWFGGDSQSGLFDPKRSGKNGFHEGIFDEGFGGFSTLKKRGKRSEEWKNKLAKRRPEMTSRGIHGDAFTGQIIWKSHAQCSPKCNWNVPKISNFSGENSILNFPAQIQFDIFGIPIRIFCHFFALRPNKLSLYCVPKYFWGFFEKGANFSHLHFDCTFQVQIFFRSENHEFLTKTKSWFLSTFFLSYFVHLHICDSHLPTPAP